MSPGDATSGAGRDADARLAAIEQAVEALRQEVAALRTAAPAAPNTTAAAASTAPQTPSPPATYGAPRPPRVPRPRPAAALGAAARDWMMGLGVPEFPADRAGFETLVGRYAAVGVGALVLLMGVGAFLTWAVENFTLAPAARVALGAAGAAALAALGERLRRREGAQRFGETLLALALAVVHVDAWAAGPYLHVIGPGPALGAAAAASLALAVLAWRARQQSLFVVGVGGALLAPFISGAGDAYPLARSLYGWVVITAGLLALVRGSTPDRPWRGATRLLALGVSGYTVAQFDYVAADHGARAAARAAGAWLPQFAPQRVSAEWPAAFALACAAGPLAAAWGRARARGGTAAVDATGVLLARLALAALVTAVLALAASAVAASPEPSLVGYALAATLGALAAGALPVAARVPRTRGGRPRRRWGGPTPAVAGLVLPLGALAAALIALGHTGTPAAAAIAALWAGVSAGAAGVTWRRTATGGRPDPRLGPHVAAAEFASALALVLWTNAHDVLRVALLGAHAAIASGVFARAPGRSTERDHRPLLALAAPLVVLLGATGWAAELLGARAAFAYTPFLTASSAGAAVVVSGWAACATAVWRSGDMLLPRGERAAVVALAAAVALLWGRAELGRAVAPDVATFLLVGYFATAGLATLAVGRARRWAAARQAGLAVALYAALKAIVEVSQLDAVALRVGSYLLVGGFLLGVGYWYRGSTEREPAAALPPAV